MIVAALILMYLAIGFVACKYWERKGDIKPGENIWGAVLLGPGAFPFGSLKWGDSGVTLDKAITRFGLCGAIFGGTTPNLFSTVALMFLITLLPIGAFIVKLPEGNIALLVSLAGIEFCFAYFMFKAWRWGFTRLKKRTEESH